MSGRGMQHERTSLAWQRTALSLMGAAAGAARLGYERIGPGAVAIAAAGFAASGWVFWTSRARYPVVGRPTCHRQREGRSGMALAATVVLLAGLELACLVAAR